MEKSLYGSCARILHAFLNKSREQHCTKQQLYFHLPPITQTKTAREAVGTEGEREREREIDRYRERDRERERVKRISLINMI